MLKAKRTLSIFLSFLLIDEAEVHSIIRSFIRSRNAKKSAVYNGISAKVYGPWTQWYAALCSLLFVVHAKLRKPSDPERGFRQSSVRHARCVHVWMSCNKSRNVSLILTGSHWNGIATRFRITAVALPSITVQKYLRARYFFCWLLIVTDTE